MQPHVLTVSSDNVSAQKKLRKALFVGEGSIVDQNVDAAPLLLTVSSTIALRKHNKQSSGRDTVAFMSTLHTQANQTSQLGSTQLLQLYPIQIQGSLRQEHSLKKMIEFRDQLLYQDGSVSVWSTDKMMYVKSLFLKQW